jgi:predicted MFS family arabinose efflux permease
LDGVRAVAADRAVRSFLIISGATVFTMGLVNVDELLLARNALGLGDSQFSALVAAMGGGIAAGSLLGSAGGAADKLKRNFLRGILCCGVAAVAAGLAPSFAVALVAFGAMGIGNGAVIAHEGVLLQTVVPDHALGRMFGVKNALVSWCFAASFASAGALAVAIGPRGLFVLAGAGTLAACSYGTIRLRTAWTQAPGSRERPALVPVATPA